jgi:site-specific DNA-methyltransferase (adenine-specific)
MTLKLFNADCLEKMKDISDNSIDLIICDLPYGCLTGGGVEEKKRRRFINGKDTGTEIKQNEGVIAGCSWDVKIDLDAFWKQVKRIRKDDHTPCIHFCSTKFGYDLINSNPKEFRYDLVWCKSNAVGFLSSNKKPMSAHEMIYVFSKLGANYNRIDLIGDYPKGGGGRSKSTFIPAIEKIVDVHTTEAGRRCVKSWFEIANKKKKGGHPTAKAIDLYKWLISRYSNPGDTILDPTFGSCNSGEVATELGRNYIGIEMDKGFYDKAVERLITE